MAPQYPQDRAAEELRPRTGRSCLPRPARSPLRGGSRPRPPLEHQQPVETTALGPLVFARGRDLRRSEAEAAAQRDTVSNRSAISSTLPPEPATSPASSATLRRSGGTTSAGRAARTRALPSLAAMISGMRSRTSFAGRPVSPPGPVSRRCVRAQAHPLPAHRRWPVRPRLAPVQTPNTARAYARLSRWISTRGREARVASSCEFSTMSQPSNRASLRRWFTRA